ncbi:MAG: hypothetical protein H7832_04370 [Magnetococcus sp. DMHC-6]
MMIRVKRQDSGTVFQLPKLLDSNTIQALAAFFPLPDNDGPYFLDFKYTVNMDTAALVMLKKMTESPCALRGKLSAINCNQAIQKAMKKWRTIALHEEKS